MSKPVILIGVPSPDMVHADFCFSLSQLFGETLGHGISVGVSNVKCTIVPQGRNLIVKEALRNNVTHLLFIDSDMAFVPQVALRLLSLDKDIVGATYCSRRPPFVLLHHNDDSYTNVRELGADVPYRVNALPFGMVMIKMDVFRTLSEPWFVWDIAGEVGEDINFCRVARAAGYDIWLDPDTSANVRHCGLHFYGLQDAKPADINGTYLSNDVARDLSHQKF